MSFLDGLPVNFTISERAKVAFEAVRRLYLEHSDDPPAILMVGWGTAFLDDGRTGEGVVVGYYCETERAEAERGVETVSGVDLLFLVAPEDHPRFAGKVLDHDPRRGFVLI